MKLKPLGRTGLFVSELCLGTMTFGGGAEGIWGKIGQLQQGEAERIIGSAIDAGINFIDTADVYAAGRSEEITGQALRNLKLRARQRRRRDQGVRRDRAGREPARRDAQPHRLGAEGEPAPARSSTTSTCTRSTASIRRRRSRRRCARSTRWSQHGHVRYVGVSNWAAWQIMKALGIAERLGLARFESLQAYYTIAGRDLERELVPMLQSEGIGLMVWSPLAGGFLSGKYGRDQKGEAGDRRDRVRLPAGRQGARLRRHRRDARGRDPARRLGGADRARLAAAPAGGDERDHRREEGRAARRQHRRDPGRAVRPTSWRASARRARCRPSTPAGCSRARARCAASSSPTPSARRRRRAAERYFGARR